MTTLRSLCALLFVCLLLTQCKKSEDAPPQTAPVFDSNALPVISGISSTSATITSVIKTNGGAAISQRGHAWSKTNSLPTLTDAKTESGISSATFPFSFTDQLTGLESNTTYYVRAYSTNSVGTAYGPVAQFKTAALPTLPTAPVIGLVLTRAASIVCNNVNESNGGPILQQGFVWSKTSETPTPTILNNKRELGPAAGTAPYSLTAILSELAPGSTYSVRAFATNTNGTAYSPAATFQSVVELPNAITNKPLGRSTGDPHFATYDYATYAFRGAGEFVVTKSTTDKFEVQARQQEVKSLSGDGSVTFNTGVAIHTGNDVVCIYPPNQLYVNKSLLSASFTSQGLANGGQLSKLDNVVTLRNGQGDNVRVVVYENYVDYYVQPAASRTGKLTGLMGNFDGNSNNDVVLANGASVVTDYANLYPSYSNAWRVDPAVSNFVYLSGQTTATFTDAAFPRKDVILSSAQRSQAEQTCRAKGVTNPALLEECIVDVAVTGNTALADRNLAVQNLINPMSALTIGNFADPAAPLGRLANATIAYGGVDLIYPATNSSATMPINRNLDLTSGFECSFDVSGRMGERIILTLNLPNNYGYTYLGLFTDAKNTSPVAIFNYDATPTVNTLGGTIFDGRLHTVRLIVRPGTNNLGTFSQIYLDNGLIYQCQNGRNTTTQLGSFNSISISAFNNPAGPGQYHIQNFSFKTL